MAKKIVKWNKDGAIQEKIDYLAVYCRTVVKVDSHERYHKVASSLRAIASIIAEVQEDFVEGKKIANDSHKAVCTSENKLLDPLKELDKQLRVKILVWRDFQDNLEKVAIAELLEEDPNATIPPSKIPELDGVAIRFEFVPLIVDQTELPREFMIPDKALIKEFGRKTGGAGKIPGVVFKKVSKLIVSKSPNFEE